MKLNQIASLMTLRILAAGALTALFCSCAATTVKSTSKAPDYQGGRINNLAALAIDERPLLRQGFENRFVNQLRKGGATAITTFNLLPLDEISHDKPAAAERFRSAGAEALVTIRLVDSATYYREFRSGPERYAETITGFQPGMWYDYYSVAFMDMSTTYGSNKQQIYLETIVFDLKTAKRLWSGLTETVVTDNMDRVAEMDPLVEKVVASMRKDGVVP
jgi:hypothetical protein